MRRDAQAHTMIRIAIVDDHAMVRVGLRQFFADQSDFRVVAEAANGREALDIVRKGEVDVIVMDIAMPDHSGVEWLSSWPMASALGAPGWRTRPCRSASCRCSCALPKVRRWGTWPRACR